MESGKLEESRTDPEEPGPSKQLLVPTTEVTGRSAKADMDAAGLLAQRERLHTMKDIPPLPLNSEMSSIRVASSLNGKCYRTT